MEIALSPTSAPANSGGGGADNPWVLHWKPADSPPPTEDDVLVVVRDKDGELLYRIAHHYRETERTEEDNGKPFWWFTDDVLWPEESLVKWSPLPPISTSLPATSRRGQMFSVLQVSFCAELFSSELGR
jgi:hypothetical protein